MDIPNSLAGQLAFKNTDAFPQALMNF